MGLATLTAICRNPFVLELIEMEPEPKGAVLLRQRKILEKVIDPFQQIFKKFLILVQD